MTQQIKDIIDEGNLAVEAFDTVNHNIFLKKLEHYGKKGIANKCFLSYLANR